MAEPARRLGGRRAYDSVPPEVLLAIDEAVTESRHALRDEIVALATRVEAGTLQSAKEHAEVKIAVADQHADVAEIKDDIKRLVPRIESLEKNDAVLSALASNRRWLIGAVTAIGALIVSASAFIVGNLPH